MSKATVEDVCRSAWEATRAESTVPFDDLTEDYRANLIKRAEAVLGGEQPAEPWLAFETQVLQIADGRGNMQVGSEVVESSGAIKEIDDVHPVKLETVVSPEGEAVETQPTEQKPPRTSKKSAKKPAAKKPAVKKPVKVIKKAAKGSKKR